MQCAAYATSLTPVTQFRRYSSQSLAGIAVARRRVMVTPLQRIVYVLKNSENPPRYDTGLTCDLRGRLEAHNAGRCSQTAKHRPWSVDVVIKFADERRALKFEKYLKSGSGVEFARRHLR
jgi:putative endonuclease